MNTASKLLPRLHWRVRPWLLALFLGLGSLALWSSNAFWNALSPVTHKQSLYRLAGRAKVDPLLLAAIVRAESGFNPFAESHRGALGLMQLMPGTALAMAKELKVNYQDRDDLYTQDINLTLGTHYFAKMLKAFDGDLILALAAYNAGPTKVRSWALQPYGEDQAVLVDSIPLAETRIYVRKVLWYYRFFKRMQTVKRFLNGDPEL
jgi:soluble lytic murein transglycosylase